MTCLMIQKTHIYGLRDFIFDLRAFQQRFDQITYGKSTFKYYYTHMEYFTK